ncbi:phosphatidylserine/phosphatidylglycerophosphate/cardiolipin synthase-like enzyme [Knoellia remsis]|uniref:Phosphatidylserine/phosphatidylglycerophosphate/ cardiolipin synthase-like enzyme n=1 Tax=Knoellia remsis TaxID=407159 RepID=A0A2T0UFH0_9MICO|nr:phospholipase D-like domain-containing protein [Knoellia remsis]PRY56624.1 phosphatidylserine/phosphatidylglycerophosphate/cardiolipin synthase-like enzyme [Knoellia remsis]
MTESDSVPQHVARWLLPRSERDNPATSIDEGHPSEQAWSSGNVVTPIVDGADYFAQLKEVIDATGEGDLVLYAGWRADADEQLTDDPGSTLLDVLDAAEDREVLVRALVWRSHAEAMDFSAEANRETAEGLSEVDDEHAEFLLDMRVRHTGAHHQKFVVVRHRDDSSRDIAFVGGIDVAHSRRDTSEHHGDPQQQGLSDEYGPRPGWHDVQCSIVGPAVADVERVFRERWDDPSPLEPSLLHRVVNRVRGTVPMAAEPLPAAWPAPPPVDGGRHVVQLLRTYPRLRRTRSYPFAPFGERSIARGLARALGQARGLVYIEDQYLWSRSIMAAFAKVLRENPELRMIAVLPHHTDVTGFGRRLQQEGRAEALRDLEEAAPGRFAAYGIENHAGWPVYVHAKVKIIDDWYATIGSDNLNRRSWTHDSELAALVIDGEGVDHSPFARGLRLRLAAEHLDRPLSGPSHEEALADCVSPEGMFEAYASSAAALQAWHDGGRVGPRPAGRLRPLEVVSLGRVLERVLEVPQRIVGDPDGRPRTMRMRRLF